MVSSPLSNNFVATPIESQPGLEPALCSNVVRLADWLDIATVSYGPQSRALPCLVAIDLFLL